MSSFIYSSMDSEISSEAANPVKSASPHACLGQRENWHVGGERRGKVKFLPSHPEKLVDHSDKRKNLMFTGERLKSHYIYFKNDTRCM